jgi:hypothetical protein
MAIRSLALVAVDGAVGLDDGQQGAEHENTDQ